MSHRTSIPARALLSSVMIVGLLHGSGTEAQTVIKHKPVPIPVSEPDFLNPGRGYYNELWWEFFWVDWNIGSWIYDGFTSTDPTTGKNWFYIGEITRERWKTAPIITGRRCWTHWNYLFHSMHVFTNCSWLSWIHRVTTGTSSTPGFEQQKALKPRLDPMRS